MNKSVKSLLGICAVILTTTHEVKAQQHKCVPGEIIPNSYIISQVKNSTTMSKGVTGLTKLESSFRISKGAITPVSEISKDNSVFILKFDKNTKAIDASSKIAFIKSQNPEAIVTQDFYRCAFEQKKVSGRVRLTGSPIKEYLKSSYYSTSREIHPNMLGISTELSNPFEVPVLRKSDVSDRDHDVRPKYLFDFNDDGLADISSMFQTTIPSGSFFSYMDSPRNDILSVSTKPRIISNTTFNDLLAIVDSDNDGKLELFVHRGTPGTYSSDSNYASVYYDGEYHNLPTVNGNYSGVVDSNKNTLPEMVIRDGFEDDFYLYKFHEVSKTSTSLLGICKAFNYYNYSFDSLKFIHQNHSVDLNGDSSEDIFGFHNGISAADGTLQLDFAVCPSGITGETIAEPYSDTISGLQPNEIFTLLYSADVDNDGIEEFLFETNTFSVSDYDPSVSTHFFLRYDSLGNRIIKKFSFPFNIKDMRDIDGDGKIDFIGHGFFNEQEKYGVLINQSTPGDIKFSLQEIATGQSEPSNVLIFDPAGIMGAKITLRSSSGQNYSTLTDHSGEFNFTSIPNGNYSVTATRNGYSLQYPQSITVNNNNSELLVDASQTIPQMANYTLPLGAPNDEGLSTQWAISNQGQIGGVPGVDIKGIEAWKQSKGDGIVTAVIDSGVDYLHPDLISQLWINNSEIAGDGIDNDNDGFIDNINGVDTDDGSSDPVGFESHGTHVAGIIAASQNNNIGITGVAPNSKIYAIKASSDIEGTFSASSLLKAYAHVIKKKEQGVPIKIMNLSLGGSSCTAQDKTAFNRMNELGIVIVGASGNDGINVDSNPSFPTSCELPNLIGVANMQAAGDLSQSSNFGAQLVHVAAPGEDIVSTVIQSRYLPLSGTSMAAPAVSGIIALMYSVNPSLTPVQIRQILIDTSVKNPQLNRKITSGGYVNADAAVTMAKTFGSSGGPGGNNSNPQNNPGGLNNPSSSISILSAPTKVTGKWDKKKKLLNLSIPVQANATYVFQYKIIKAGKKPTKKDKYKKVTGVKNLISIKKLTSGQTVYAIGYYQNSAGVSSGSKEAKIKIK